MAVHRTCGDPSGLIRAAAVVVDMRAPASDPFGVGPNRTVTLKTIFATDVDVLFLTSVKRSCHSSPHIGLFAGNFIIFAIHENDWPHLL